MINNYLKISWRNLLKNKTFSLINIIGLAIGLACFILIALYVADELSYDRHHENADRIYRVNADIRIGGTDLRLATASDPMGPTLKNEYPQVEAYVRFYASSGSKLIKKGSQFIPEARVTHADSTLFDVFALPVINGDTKTALNKPNTVVVTESAAKRHFNTIDVVGKFIETNDHNAPYQITTVIRDIPHNTHFNFDFIFSMENVDYPWGNFLSNNFQTYILLQQGVDYKEFEKNFIQITDKYILPQAKQMLDIQSMEDFTRSGNMLEYSLMPVRDIHLHSDRFPELGVNGNIQYVYIFASVALFVLLLACINFMNLSTARSISRAKEVSIRKVLGTERKSLIGQFLTESTLTAFFGLAVAVCLVAISLGGFNAISGKELGIADLMKPGHLTFLLLLALTVGTLAGLYPAFVLSSFRPLTVLKGKIGGGFRKNNFRSAMVIFQFLTSILLITGTIIIFHQLDYIRNKKIGFNKDQILIVNGTNTLGGGAEAFRQKVSNMSGVSASSYAGFLPVANSSRSDFSLSTDAVPNEHNIFSTQIWSIDYDYIPTLGINLLEGRNFSAEFGTDSMGIIINETAAGIIGLDNPVGKKLYMPQGGGSSIAYTVLGVVENFHYESLRQQIGPLCMRLGNNKSATAFKVSATDIQTLVGAIESEWKSMSPEMPFTYHFMDESFDAMYRAEQRAGNVALAFSVLAIMIACLGLFGLTTYMVEQRTKEIGIRKVLGASVSGIVSMLSRDFVKLVLIAIVIATPLAWWAMNKWLQEFAYRVDIQWWMFALAGLSAILIALITVGWQAIRAALANPVESLRDE